MTYQEIPAYIRTTNRVLCICILCRLKLRPTFRYGEDYTSFVQVNGTSLELQPPNSALSTKPPPLTIVASEAV